VATGDTSSEQEALHYREALEAILEIARRGVTGDSSAPLCLSWIEGRAQAALASTQVRLPRERLPPRRR
jgi:hypothetical protein